jgi:hypothetical protein
MQNRIAPKNALTLPLRHPFPIKPEIAREILLAEYTTE